MCAAQKVRESYRLEKWNLLIGGDLLIFLILSTVLSMIVRKTARMPVSGNERCVEKNGEKTRLETPPVVCFV
jgi:hypothetical protein